MTDCIRKKLMHQGLLNSEGSLRGYLIQALFLSLFFKDKMEVPEVNHKPERLAQNKDRVHPVDGVYQQNSASYDAVKPETHWDHGFFFLFRRIPLNHKTHGKTDLADKTKRQPEIKRFSQMKVHRSSLLFCMKCFCPASTGRPEGPLTPKTRDPMSRIWTRPLSAAGGRPALQRRSPPAFSSASAKTGASLYTF